MRYLSASGDEISADQFRTHIDEVAARTTVRAFVLAGTAPADLDLFLGPVNPHDEIVEYDPARFTTLAHIMHAAGFFPSVTQARRNGWDKPIPEGYSEYRVGKLKRELVVLHLLDPGGAP